MSLAFDVDRPVPIRQGVELGIGFLHRSLQQLFRERWKPQMVCFTHAAPTRKDAHRKFFGTDILFNEDFNGIVCRSGDLDAAVPAADAKMARYVQQYLDTIAARRKITMTANVRECIYTMLPSGLCSADKVAERLGVDRRTVHRHLAREGQTFSLVMDSVRAELVTRYIENRDRPLAAVSELLGFSAVSAFSRWFRNRFGCTVTDWRAERHSPPDGKDESRPETIEVNSTRANGLNVAPILKCKLISRIRSYFAEPPVPFRSALTDCSPVEIFWSSNQKCSSLSGILARPPSGPSSGRGHF